MEEVGRSLALSKLPLGFIQSAGYNKHFVMPEGLENYVRYWKERALKYFKVPLKVMNDPARVAVVDLLTTIYLEMRGMVYVSYVEVQDEDVYQGAELKNSVYTLDKGIIEACSTESCEKILEVVQNAQKGLKRFVDVGDLPGVIAKYNQNMVFKFTNPRKKVNFGTYEYSVVPLPFVQGYVDGLKELMKNNLVVVDARTLKGNMREFSISSSAEVVEEVYGYDTDLIEMFSILRGKFDVNYYNHYPVVVGLHNANFKVYELGIPKVEYLQRHLNVLRIARVQVLTDEERTKHVRVLKRYADVDFDALVSKVENVVVKWDTPKIVEFMQVTIGKTQVTTGSRIKDIDIEIQGRADFIMKFRRTIDQYSTGYLRSVVDYVLSHPMEFDGYTGERVQTSAVLSHVKRAIPSEKIPTNKNLENPFFSTDLEEISFEVVEDVE